ncbi:hypothetical protein SAMN04487972_1047 [Paracoccus halophilus]|uniref:Uncharacterized protein n=1 Tax=Paracoccus halophilus TaxID=376733 RepID=A0A1I0T0B9_9RHOB|nr:hypothetical protein [Paracoccus halophilus]SFA45238.1 hypothetical protein SAMN04487972_1047 [Paracoccus halophilus]
MIALLLISVALANEPSETPVTREGLIREVTNLLLNGEALPPDLDARLMALAPADRIEVLIFLRRSGMLTGPSWSSERLLVPARPGDPSR